MFPVPPSPLRSAHRLPARRQSTYRESKLTCSLNVDDLIFEADLEHVIDLSVAFEPGKGNAFGLEPPSTEALLPSGSGLCVQRVAFCAHASGTHTECLLHIDPLIQIDMSHTDAWKEGIVPCTVIRVVPVALGQAEEHYEPCTPIPDPEELVITKSALELAFSKIDVKHRDFLCCVLVLTDGVPAFFSNQAMAWLVGQKCTRLLVDQPSVDRMVCGPGMPAHRTFFGRRPWATITEMVRCPARAEAPDGLYFLNMHLAPLLQTDAVPSRPILHRALFKGHDTSHAGTAGGHVPKMPKLT